MRSLLLSIVVGFIFPAASLAQQGDPIGPEQRLLQRFAGSYVATVRSWDSPGAEPDVTRHLSEQRMIMDSRFLQVEDRSEDGGYFWRAVHGFDPSLGHYRSIGISNVSNSFSIADSFISEDGKWILIGSSGPNAPFKGVGFLTEEGYTYRNFRIEPDGSEVLYREIVYVRR